MATSWADISQRYANEWVCLLDIEHGPDGSIKSARVIAHDGSITKALDQLGSANPDATIVHTWGRPLWTPRTEIVDETGIPVRIPW